MSGIIEFKKVSKKFSRGRRPFLKQALLDLFRRNQEENFWALKDVSFTIQKGESVGIIGLNGSGKSTILKLIAGVLFPTEGEVRVEGRIGPLIELGAGFHPELSGRDNIYLNGTILGLSKNEIDQKFDDIVGFAELQEFIDTPVKHYSSGMYMRLGFSIAVHIEPDILLIDEILTVGDAHFQNKSFKKLQEFKKRGTTIVLISHSIGTVEQFCDKVIYLKKGQTASLGKTQQIITRYQHEVMMEESRVLKKADSNNQRWGSGETLFNSVDILNSGGEKVNLLKTGGNYRVRFKYKVARDVEKLNFGIGIYKESGEYCFGINTQMDKFNVERSGNVELSIYDLALNTGEYYYNAVCFGEMENYAYDWIGSAGRFIVTNDSNHRGLMTISHQWKNVT